ncbi:MAG: hypothetical protein DRG78_00695 [Epsilonproteobacteria bacterium]|nr:MAG: hypothetical protein DRG78_00695 [Campylobacterota bacterium]
MSSKHHETIKKQQRLGLLKKVVNTLISLKPTKSKGVVLNNKEYFKINFSGQQVIDAMSEYASYEEGEAGLILTDRTAISKSNEYMDIVEEAKKKRISNGSIGRLDMSNSLKEVEMELKINLMAAEILNLTEENNALEMIVEREEMSRSLEVSNPLVSMPSDTLRDRQLDLFIQLLGMLTRDGIVQIDKLKTGTKVLFYEGININKRICGIGDLKDLNYGLTIEKGIEIIKSNKFEEVS